MENENKHLANENDKSKQVAVIKQTSKEVIPTSIVNKIPRKKKKKHNSALLAAYKASRSAVGHVMARHTTGMHGEYANLGTNVSYEEEPGQI